MTWWNGRIAKQDRLRAAQVEAIDQTMTMLIRLFDAVTERIQTGTTPPKPDISDLPKASWIWIGDEAKIQGLLDFFFSWAGDAQQSKDLRTAEVFAWVMKAETALEQRRELAVQGKGDELPGGISRERYNEIVVADHMRFLVDDHLQPLVTTLDAMRLQSTPG